MNTFAKNIPVRGNVTSGMDRVLNMPRARVYHAANVPISVGAAALGFDVTDYDTDGMAVLGTAAAGSGIRCNTQGLYLCTACLDYPGAGGTYRQTYIARTSTTYGNNLFGITTTPGGAAVTHSPSDVILLAAGDLLQLWEGSDFGLTLTGGTQEMFLSACMISTL